MKRLGNFLLYTYLVLLWIMAIMYLLPSSPDSSDTAAAILYLALFFIMIPVLGGQLNVVLLLAWLLYKRYSKRNAGSIPARMIGVFAANWLGVMVIAYHLVTVLYQSSDFPRQAAMYYGMNRSMVSTDHFWGKVYAVYGLGCYGVATIYDYLAHGRMRQIFSDEEYAIWASLNTLLSTLLLLLCVFYYYRRRAKA